MSPAPRKLDETKYSGRFSARLRTLREKTGMTGREFAKAMIANGYDFAERSYYHWETGRAQPPLDAFPVIAKLLGLSSPRLLLPTE